LLNYRIYKIDLNFKLILPTLIQHYKEKEQYPNFFYLVQEYANLIKLYDIII